MMEKIKRLLALTGAILLIILYVSTLIFSLMSGELAQGLFRASIFCTVAVPVLLYAYMMIYRVLRGRGVRHDRTDDAPQKSGQAGNGRANAGQSKSSPQKTLDKTGTKPASKKKH